MATQIQAGHTFGSVESVKAVSDLYSPVSGTVTEVNEDLNYAPERINADANNTWMLKVELTDALESESLLSAADYDKFISRRDRTLSPMRYLPKSPQDRDDMLADIGVASIDDLFSTIPEEYQLKRDLCVPRQHAESEILDRFRGPCQRRMPAATPASLARACTATTSPLSSTRWSSAASS